MGVKSGGHLVGCGYATTRAAWRDVRQSVSAALACVAAVEVRAASVGRRVCRCAICLGDYEEDEEAAVLPCGHMFHAPCVTEWFQRSRECPMCKDDVAVALQRQKEGGKAASGGRPPDGMAAPGR